MEELRRVVGTLKACASDPEIRGALVAIVDCDGELDIRIPPRAALRSPETFFFSIRESLREARASSIGVVLPIRTLWGHESVCPYPDAEALALVAAEDVGDGVNSVGQTCPLHALPHGWLEAHERLQSIAGPLRLALAGRPLEEEEAV